MAHEHAGRYVKVLIDKAFGVSDAKKGDYFRINAEGEGIITRSERGETWTVFPLTENPPQGELMPIGFHPDGEENLDIPKVNCGSFKVGDKVQEVKNYDDPDEAPRTGTVTGFDNESWQSVLVKFDVASVDVEGTPFYDHTGKYIAEDGQGEWMDLENLVPYTEFQKSETNLEKAKRLYPKGTKYKSVPSEVTYTSEKAHKEYDSGNIDCGGGYVYRKDVDKWAEILSEAKAVEEPKVSKDMTNEELLEKAKKDYPVGTKFRDADNGTSEYTVKEDLYWQEKGITHLGLLWVYYDGKWAEIISKPESKPQFEVGKWYQRTDPNPEKSWDYWVKCSSSDPFKDSESITFGGVHNSNGFSGRSTSNWRLVTDLSEIQQYLPEGHPDKLSVKTDPMKELTELPEKWCVAITKESLESVNNVRAKQASCNNPLKLGEYKYYGKQGSVFEGIEVPNSEVIKITFEQFKKWILKSDTLKVEDLVEGEIYKYDGHIIAQYPKGSAFSKVDGIFHKQHSWAWSLKKEKATDEEKQWLNACIKAGKFVSLEDSKKSDVPEYVECVKLHASTIDMTLHRVYSTDGIGNWFDNVGDKRSTLKIFLAEGYFKPSTKAAYDAQNKVKEVEEDLTGRYLKALVDSPQSTTYKKGEYAKVSEKYVSGQYWLDGKKWIYSIGTSTTSHFELMPKGFTPPTEEEDYQNLTDLEVGDTVRCISENKSKISNGAGGAGWQKGKEFVIGDSRSVGNGKVYFPVGGSYGVYSDAVRLVKKKDEAVACEAPKVAVPIVDKWIPQVGEYCIRLNDNHGNVKVGEVRKIVALDGKQPILENDLEKYSHNPVNLRKALPHEIPSLAMQEKTVSESPKFKAGDRVRIVKKFVSGGFNWDASMDRFIGTEAVVERIGNDRDRCLISGWWFLVESLEPVSQKVESIEEILAEARRWYPIGTKFKCAAGGGSYQVSRELIIQHGGISHPGISWVYIHQKWAEIVSTPVQVPQRGDGILPMISPKVELLELRTLIHEDVPAPKDSHVSALDKVQLLTLSTKF